MLNPLRYKNGRHVYTGGGGEGETAMTSFFFPAGSEVKAVVKKNTVLLTLLGLQSRFADNWVKITWNLGGLFPKRDWSSKGVND